jgi:cobalamin biosynthesis Mg chelatase CobN
MHNPKKFILQQGVIIGKHGYEQSVILRAMERAGNNPHLKGHIHEVLVQDAKNLRNLLTGNGATTTLTKSTTAGTVDLITTKGGKVIERIQVKDVTSQSGIDKLVKQCAQGKYRSAQLVGSEETAQAFNKAAEKAGISKRMTSTGISSKSTESLAQRAGATGSGSLSSAIGQAAKTGGAVGAVVGGGVELVKGCIDLVEGTADAVEVAGRVAKAGAKGGVSGAAAGAGATVAGAGAATVVSALGLTGMAATAIVGGAPIVAAVAVGYVASKAFDSICDFLSDWF